MVGAGYHVGGVRHAHTRWLTIPRSDLQLVFRCFPWDLARNGWKLYVAGAYWIVGVGFCIRVVSLISHLHEDWLYIIWRRFQNPHQSTLCWIVWLERDIMLVAVAGSCWLLDPFRVDDLSIHRMLEIHWCCFYFFVSPNWVDLHFVWIDWLGLCPPSYFLYLFFPFFK